MLVKLYKMAEYGSFGLDMYGAPDPKLLQRDVDDAAKALQLLQKYIKVESVISDKHRTPYAILNAAAVRDADGGEIAN